MKFYAVLINTKTEIDTATFTISYSVFLDATEGEIMYKSRCITKLFAEKDEKLLCQLHESYVTTERKKYLPNETFTICFKFQQFYKLYNNTISYSYEPNVSIMNMQNFISTEKSGSLVTFVIDEKYLQANKILLCSKSKVFEAMFNCDLKENANNKIKITDIKYDILQEMLFFIHTGQISTNVSMCKIRK